MDSLIDHLLGSVRVYFGGDRPAESLIYMNGPQWCKILEVKNELETWYAVRHILDLSPPGYDVTHDLVRPVTLPPDVIAFYRRIHSGVFVWRKQYVLAVPGSYDIGHLSPWRQMPAETGYHLLRFCEIADPDCFYALRSKDNGVNWDVVLATDECSDLETVEEAMTMHATFTSWLERMIRDEGWPPIEGLIDPDVSFIPPYCERVPDAEAEAMFGPLQSLLPPIQHKVYWPREAT